VSRAITVEELVEIARSLHRGEISLEQADRAVQDLARDVPEGTPLAVLEEALP
jgi:hypothetical protein